jgi:hypothetical protein
MVKSKGLSWIAVKNHKILAFKVQYSHCSKFDDCFGKILEKHYLELKTLNRVGENVSQITNQEKIARSANWFHRYEP